MVVPPTVTDCEPEVDTDPLQPVPPDALQLVAFEDDHVSVTGLFVRTSLTDADNVTVGISGAGGGLDPPPPPQAVKINNNGIFTRKRLRVTAVPTSLLWIRVIEFLRS